MLLFQFLRKSSAGSLRSPGVGRLGIALMNVRKGRRTVLTGIMMGLTRLRDFLSLVGIFTLPQNVGEFGIVLKVAGKEKQYAVSTGNDGRVP